MHFLHWRRSLCSLVTGLAGTAWSITGTVESKAEESCLEDGEFVMSAPLSEEQEEVVGSMEFLLEDTFYLDFKQSDGSILRLMKNRERINQAEVSEGQVAQNENEIVLERIYAKTHGLGVGDTVVLGEREFTVFGIGTSADYELCVENLTDMAADGNAFGTAFVTLEAYRFLEESGQAARAEGIVYGFCLRPDTSQTDAPEGKSTADNEAGNSTDERMDELRMYLSESGGLLRFTESDRNPRIGAAVDDVQINIRASLTAGVIVLILLAFVISVFVVHSIDRESAVIGTLYAMGVKRGELMLSYTWLPVLVCLAGGVLGTALGFSPAAFLLLRRFYLQLFFDSGHLPCSESVACCLRHRSAGTVGISGELSGDSKQTGKYGAFPDARDGEEQEGQPSEAWITDVCESFSDPSPAAGEEKLSGSSGGNVRIAPCAGSGAELLYVLPEYGT